MVGFRKVGWVTIEERDSSLHPLGYHNLREFFDGQAAVAAQFDQWLTNAVTQQDEHLRKQALVQWDLAPQVRISHPREEHFLPLMVVAGAGGRDAARLDFYEIIGGKPISGCWFGSDRG